MVQTSMFASRGCDMPSKVTMQDIADALKLSRNTVSKAINNTGVIAENTKETILRKAAEMGYRSLTGAAKNSDSGQTAQGPAGVVSKKEIAMLTCS